MTKKQPAKTPRRKPYGKMSASELAAATRQFERGVRFEDTRPMSPKNHQRWQRAKRGRPTVGKGAKVVAVSIEADLLQRALAYARKNNLSRSQLFARGLQELLHVQGGART